MNGITTAGINTLIIIAVILGVRAIAGFREDYLHFQDNNFTPKTYYEYIRAKIGK